MNNFCLAIVASPELFFLLPYSAFTLVRLKMARFGIILYLHECTGSRNLSFSISGSVFFLQSVCNELDSNTGLRLYHSSSGLEFVRECKVRQL